VCVCVCVGAYVLPDAMCHRWQEWMSAHLSVNDIAYPPSGSPSATGALLTQVHPVPAGTLAVVRYPFFRVLSLTCLVGWTPNVCWCAAAVQS
jgi:hypothetical protein